MTDTIRPHLYADGIGKVRLENGMVKLDLYTLTDGHSQRVAQPSATVVMSPEGFQQALKTLNSFQQELQSKAASKKAAE